MGEGTHLGSRGIVVLHILKAAAGTGNELRNGGLLIEEVHVVGAALRDRRIEEDLVVKLLWLEEAVAGTVVGHVVRLQPNHRPPVLGTGVAGDARAAMPDARGALHPAYAWES